MFSSCCWWRFFALARALPQLFALEGAGRGLPVSPHTLRDEPAVPICGVFAAGDRRPAASAAEPRRLLLALIMRAPVGRAAFAACRPACRSRVGCSAKKLSKNMRGLVRSLPGYGVRQMNINTNINIPVDPTKPPTPDQARNALQLGVAEIQLVLPSLCKILRRHVGIRRPEIGHQQRSTGRLSLRLWWCWLLSERRVLVRIWGLLPPEQSSTVAKDAQRRCRGISANPAMIITVRPTSSAGSSHHDTAGTGKYADRVTLAQAHQLTIEQIQTALGKPQIEANKKDGSTLTRVFTYLEGIFILAGLRYAFVAMQRQTVSKFCRPHHHHARLSGLSCLIVTAVRRQKTRRRVFLAC